jgi:hypothetical protein
MKVVQSTPRLLKLRQVNWMPWYGHLILWPTVSILMISSFFGESFQLTCSRASGQCELKNEFINGTSTKSLPIDTVTKIDVVATDSTSEEPTARMVLITKDAEVNLGLPGGFEARDRAAGKLAWFFEDSSAKFIELTENSKPFATGAGLTGLAMILGGLLLRKTSVVSFDRDTKQCTVQLSRFFGLLQGRSEVCWLAAIQNVNLSGSLKVADDRILIHQSGRLSFFLTDHATHSTWDELTAINSIKDFLGLSLHQSQSSPQNDSNTEGDWVEQGSAYYGGSTEEYITTENYHPESSHLDTNTASNSTDSSSDSSSSDSSSSSD